MDKLFSVVSFLYVFSFLIKSNELTCRDRRVDGADGQAGVIRRMTASCLPES